MYLTFDNKYLQLFLGNIFKGLLRAPPPPIGSATDIKSAVRLPSCLSEGDVAQWWSASCSLGPM